MAKKRGSTPLGNAPGAENAQKTATIESLSHKLSDELMRAGKDVHAFLAERFGIQAVGESRQWSLLSGASATFSELTLSYEQVRDDTFVTFDVNGRDQSMLTPESLTDLDSLSHQQYYPAVGREINGKIDVLDGSRRRAWFLLQQGKVPTFRLLVTKESISLTDAKGLAKQLQSAKEHNQREIGLQCQRLMDAENLTQLEVAQIMGISRPAVGRALRTAHVDPRLIQLFPIVNDLSHTDYAVLDKVMAHFKTQPDQALSSFIEIIQDLVVNAQAEPAYASVKEQTIELLKSQLKLAEKKISKSNTDTIIHHLATFQSKGMYARKKVRGRNFSYEFGRLSNSIQEELDVAIKAVLSKHNKP